MEISNDLFEQAKKTIPGGVNSPVRAFRSVGGSPFFTKRADGAYLYTSDDQRLIDYVCTWGPAILGHNQPVIKEAISRALEQGTSFGTPNPYEVEMAELICELVPSVEKVRMCNSGTEATMSSIRLARGYTGRDKIIKFAGCYHGHVDSLLVKAGSGALTLGNPDSAGIPDSFARETIVLNYNDSESLKQTFANQGDQIAAVILEPYPANCGLIFPKNNFLQLAVDLCKENGSVSIFDEVMTGFRVSLGGVQEHVNIIPDMTALGKIIGGGLPVGAFGGRKEIMDHLAPLGPVYQAGTLSGNPLAMAAGIAALKMLQSTNPYKDLNCMGRKLKNSILQAAAEKGVALQVPQVGSMFAIFFNENPVENFDHAIRSDVDSFKKVFQYSIKNGVYIAPSAFETCFISTCHAGDPVDISSQVLGDAIKNL